MLPGFVRGQKEQAGGAVEPLFLARRETAATDGDGKVDFAGDLDALTGDIEEGDRFYGDAAETKAFRVFLPARAERRNNARAGDDDAGGSF